MDRSLQAEKDIIRLPLYSDDSNRTYTAGQANGVLSDSVLINCWAKPLPDGSHEIIKRPGIGNEASNTSRALAAYVNDVTQCTPKAVLMMQNTQLGSFIWGFGVAVFFDRSVNRHYFVTIASSGTSGEIGFQGVAAATNYIAGTESDKIFLTELVIGGVLVLGIIVESNSYYGTGHYITSNAAGYFDASCAITQITDVDFPGVTYAYPYEYPVGPMVQLNQHVFVMGRSGKVYNADQDSISSWNVRGVQPASIEPDKGVGLAKYKQHIVAFGTDSIEFFEDAGLAPPGGPLQRTEQAFIKIGCITSSAYYSINDELFWLAGGSQSARGLYRMNQYTPEKIRGMPAMAHENKTYWNIRLDSITLNGETHLLINGAVHHSTPMIPKLAGAATFTPTGTATESFPILTTDIQSTLLCYALDSKTWWWWADGNMEFVGIFSARTFISESEVAGGYSTSGGKYASQVVLKQSKNFTNASTNTGAIYTIFDPAPGYTIFYDETSARNMDAATPVCITIQVNPLEFNVENRKIINKMKISADSMSKYSGDASTGNQMYFLYNRNDGQGTVFSRPIDIPSVNNRYYINKLGTARKFSCAIVSKTAMPFRAKALELHVTQGTA